MSRGVWGIELSGEIRTGVRIELNERGTRSQISELSGEKVFASRINNWSLLRGVDAKARIPEKRRSDEDVPRGRVKTGGNGGDA